MMLSELYAQGVTVLADISGDGTSNGAIVGIVNRVCQAAAVVTVALFVISLVTLMMSHSGVSGGGGGAANKRQIMHVTGVFIFIEGLIATAFVIANYGQQIVQGVVS